MRIRYLVVFIATIFAIAIVTSANQIFGQTPITAKGQAALNYVANVLRVPANELQVVTEAKVDDQLTRTKVLHARTGRIAGINLDQNNRQMSAERVQQILAKKESQDFQGKFEARLWNRLNQAQSTNSTSVVVWLKTPGKPPQLRPTSTGADQAGVQTEGFSNFHENLTRPLAQFAQAQGGLVKYRSTNAPLVVVNLPNKVLSALAQRNDVQSIFLEETNYKRDMNVAAGAIDAPKVWSRGITGSGVKIAVVEDDGIYFDHSNLANGSYCKSNNKNIGNHATAVAGTIASTNSTYKGISYGAPALLSGNTGDFSDAEIIKCTDWALDNGARVINYSFSVKTNSGGSMVALDRYVDYIVRNRSVTLMKSAGNIGSTCSGANYVTSPGKGWNMITVGNYNDKGTASNSDDTISTSSCYEDPSSPNGDRQKPEVAAPGTAITTTFQTCNASTNAPCSGSGTSQFGTTSGTSFSTPITAGCAALLMQRKTTLQYWPESIKAVLMASAVTNIEGSTRLSEKDGAGGIECDSADDVVRGAAGVEAHGSFVKSDFPKTFTFSANANQTVRVALAWDSTTDSPTGTTAPTTDVLKADLDLVVYAPNGSPVSSSASYDNSYEIVEFKAASTGTYSAKVNAHRFDGNNEFLGFAAWKGTREKN